MAQPSQSPLDIPDTAATRALWAALNANPGATAGDLAEMAQVSRSTASKVLAVMEEAGRANRTVVGHTGTKRLPDRWTVATADQGRAAAEPVPSKDVPQGLGERKADRATDVAESASAGSDAEEAPASQTEAEQPDDEATPPTLAPDAAPRAVNAGAADHPADRPGTGSGARLRPGALREMVIGYLRERPDQDLSPSAIGKALERSSGAVANACDRLLADGAIVLASEKPRKFRIAAAAN